MTRQILDDTDIPSRRVQFGSHPLYIKE